MAINLSINDFFEMGMKSGSLGGGGATKVFQDSQAQRASLVPAGVSALGSLKSSEAATSAADTAKSRLTFDRSEADRSFGLEEKKLGLEERRVASDEKRADSLSSFRTGTLDLQRGRLDLDTRKASITAISQLLKDDRNTLMTNIETYAQQQFGLNPGFFGFNAEGATPQQIVEAMEYLNVLTMGQGGQSILPGSPGEVDQIEQQLAALQQEEQALLQQGGETPTPTPTPQPQAAPPPPETGGGTLPIGAQVAKAGAQEVGGQLQGLGRLAQGVAQGVVQAPPAGIAGPAGASSTPISGEQVGQATEKLGSINQAGPAGVGQEFNDMRSLFKILSKLAPQDLQFLLKLLEQDQ